MFSRAIVSVALAASALANVFITSPVASTSWPAGQSATVSWQDDGNSPSLADFGLANFAVYVGNANQQTPLQTIATYVNVSSVSSVTFTPNTSIGPSGGEYFVRATSTSYTDPSNPKYYEEAFSAKFTLTGMTGSFNTSVQAEINGQSTAPIGGSSAASAPAATAAASTTKAAAPSSASSPSSTGTATSANGAAKPVIATGFVAVAAVIIGASLL